MIFCPTIEVRENIALQYSFLSVYFWLYLGSFSSYFSAIKCFLCEDQAEWMLACVSVIASFEPKWKIHRRHCLRAIKATLVSVTARTAVTSRNFNLYSVRMKQHQNERDVRYGITCAYQETVFSLINKFVLIPTTTGCGQCAINSADDSIVEAEASTKTEGMLTL